MRHPKDHPAIPEPASLDIMRDQAAERLDEMGLAAALLIDESGQTSEEVHLLWLCLAPADKIRQWAADVTRDAE